MLLVREMKSVRSRKAFRAILRKVSDGDAVVYFTASWCKPCKFFGPVLKAVARRAKITLVKVDIDRVDPSLISRRPWRVDVVPTVFAYRNRKIRRRLESAVIEKSLEGWFREAFPAKKKVED